MLRKVAVTGGVASGKSTACRIFKELGACVVSADDIVHQLLTPNNPVGKEVIKIFGDSIVVDQSIDRKKIAEIVFNQPQLLLLLQSLIHPAVRDEVDKRYQSAKQQKKYKVFIAEIPLLFETGAEEQFEYSVCVVTNYDTCVKRYIASTGHTKEDFDKRMSNQMSPEKKAQKANWTVHNDGTIDSLRESLTKIYHALADNNQPTSA